MAVTRLGDIVWNAMFGKYFVKSLAEKSVFIKSGIATADELITRICNEIGVQGKILNMPYWNEMDGDSEVLSDSAGLTVNEIKAGQDVAVILRRGKAWGANDLVTELAGDDPMRMVANKLSDYWSREQQRVTFKTLEGVFASNEANNGGDLVMDITQEAGEDAYLTKDSLLYAAQLLGDAKNTLVAVAMHSMVETVLNVAGNSGSAFKPADTPASLPSYNGRAVVMDDNCSYNPVTGIAEILLFGSGAIALNPCPTKAPLETGRDILKANDLLTTRQAWIGHVRGVKFNSTTVTGATPSNAELALADNWTRVWSKKDIRVCKLRCKIAGAA